MRCDLTPPTTTTTTVTIATTTTTETHDLHCIHELKHRHQLSLSPPLRPNHSRSHHHYSDIDANDVRATLTATTLTATPASTRFHKFPPTPPPRIEHNPGTTNTTNRYPEGASATRLDFVMEQLCDFDGGLTGMCYSNYDAGRDAWIEKKMTPALREFDRMLGSESPFFGGSAASVVDFKA